MSDKPKNSLQGIERISSQPHLRRRMPSDKPKNSLQGIER